MGIHTTVNKFNIILASASPRRKQLLEQIGGVVDVQAVDIDESLRQDEAVEDYCLRLAIEKSSSRWSVSMKKMPVLGADTIVVTDGLCLGKPVSQEDAFDMLKMLMGKPHQVMSAVAVVYKGEMISALSTNTVEFDVISDQAIKEYVDTGEPMDKAGAYAVQGLTAMWIKQITGSYSSIMGLPLYQTTQILQKLAIIKPLN